MKNHDGVLASTTFMFFLNSEIKGSVGSFSVELHSG
jgi:hypothetical protein